MPYRDALPCCGTARTVHAWQLTSQASPVFLQPRLLGERPQLPSTSIAERLSKGETELLSTREPFAMLLLRAAEAWQLTSLPYLVAGDDTNFMTELHQQTTCRRELDVWLPSI